VSNHGPMAVEAMLRRGHDGQVHAWINRHQDRLEDALRGITPVTNKDWREAPGDMKRLGDWNHSCSVRRNRAPGATSSPSGGRAYSPA
jgi:hypothetical protein